MRRPRPRARPPEGTVPIAGSEYSIDRHGRVHGGTKPPQPVTAKTAGDQVRPRLSVRGVRGEHFLIEPPGARPWCDDRARVWFVVHRPGEDEAAWAPGEYIEAHGDTGTDWYYLNLADGRRVLLHGPSLAAHLFPGARRSD